MHRILDDEAPRRIGAHPFGGVEENVGCRFRPAGRRFQRRKDAAGKQRQEPRLLQHEFDAFGARVRADAERHRHRGDRLVHALDRPHLGAQPLVHQFLGAVDQRYLERDPGDFLHPYQDVLEGQAGIFLDEFLGRYLEAGSGQHLGLDARGDDLRIDEDAVAIENDEFGFEHDDPDRRVGAGGIHQAGGRGKSRTPVSSNIYAER